MNRTLRVFLSHNVEGQPWQTGEAMGLDPTNLDFNSGQGIPSWTFKIEGRLLEPVRFVPDTHLTRTEVDLPSHWTRNMFLVLKTGNLHIF